MTVVAPQRKHDRGACAFIHCSAKQPRNISSGSTTTGGLPVVLVLGDWSRCKGTSGTSFRRKPSIHGVEQSGEGRRTHGAQAVQGRRLQFQRNSRFHEIIGTIGPFPRRTVCAVKSLHINPVYGLPQKHPCSSSSLHRVVIFDLLIQSHSS